jgi:membrane protease subunit HflC
MRRFFIFCSVIALIGLAGLYSSLYRIADTENGVQLRAGKLPIDEAGKLQFQPPGVHFKIPFWDSVLRWDNRIQHTTLQSIPLITTEEAVIKLDYRVSWRVQEPTRYIAWVTKTQFSPNSLLLRWFNDYLQTIWKPIPLCDLISDTFEPLKTYFETQAKEIGIEIIDCKIIQKIPSFHSKKRIITQMSDNQSDTAGEHIKSAKMRAAAIQSKAKIQQAILLADAQEQAEHIKNEGENKAMQLYIDAYCKNTEFANVYQRLISGMSSLDSDKPTFVVVQVDSSVSE